MLNRRTPLPRKRATPRRKMPERVPGRMKPKANERPTPEEKRHHDRLRKLGCLVLRQNVIDSHRCAGRTTIHHTTAPITGGRIARSERLVVPLCERHHLIQHGPHESVERLGHYGFFVVYGIDLLAEAQRLWRESEATQSESKK